MPAADRALLLFTKPARAGRVKTRLTGDLIAGLSPEQAAELHAAFVGDLVARLAPEPFGLRIAWALDPGEPLPEPAISGMAGLAGISDVRQADGDLGERLYEALAAASAEAPFVAAVGSDHPTLPAALVESAFGLLAAGAQVVLGPAEDGGYYLIALAAARLGGVPRRLFDGVDWSTERVLGQTVERCRELGIELVLLPRESDVDTPEDLRRLALRLADSDLGCPRTRRLLAAWGRLPGSQATPAIVSIPEAAG